MSFRIPCGGFKLDENSFTLDKEVLSASVSWNNLKDKPFGEEVSLNDLEVLPPLAEHPMKYMGSGYGDWGEGVELVVGETYTVLFNDVEYVCVAQYVPDSIQYIYLGAPGSYANNGCPFAFVVTPTNWSCSLTLSYEGTGANTFTLAVYKGKSVIKTIDPKYIKDMYYEETTVAEVFPETVLTFSRGMAIGTNVVELQEDNTYTVKWNGVEYLCKARAASNGRLSALVLGDGSIYDLGYEDYPFFFMSVGEEYAEEVGGRWVASASDGQSVDGTTLSIRGEVTTIKQIDPKFIPSGAGGGHTVIPITLNDDETITVNTDGATVQKACDSYKNGGSVAISYNMGEATCITNAVSLMELGGGAMVALTFNLIFDGTVVGVAMIGVSPDGIIAEVQMTA